MRIESIRLKNFKAFRDIHLRDVPAFFVVVGANGSGKSTLFDVFGFLHDCLKGNVRQALDKRGRFREVLSRGCDPEKDSILIELQYRMEITGVERLVTYSLEIGEEAGSPGGISRSAALQAWALWKPLPLFWIFPKEKGMRLPTKRTSRSRMNSWKTRSKRYLPTRWPSKAWGNLNVSRRPVPSVV